MTFADFVNSRCPVDKNLVCSQACRAEEYERQMSEALLCNKPLVFVTDEECPVVKSDCLRLRTFREQQKGR